MTRTTTRATTDRSAGRVAGSLVGLAAALALALTLGSSPALAGDPDPGPVSTPRVIGGSTAPVGAWPSQAYVQIEVAPDQIAQCGGTLIDPSWVLTAAHCVTGGSGLPYSPGSVLTVIGIQNLDQILSGDVLEVGEVVVHPEWDPGNFRWDFALLRLATPSPNPTMSLIQPSQEAASSGGSRAEVAGWGCFSDVPGACDEAAGYPAQLQQASVSFVSDSVCGSFRSWSANFDPQMMICAGSYGVGKPTVCSGDSGGPLVAFAGGRRVLAGVTSFGSAEPLCVNPDLPAVFARVSSGRAWVDSVLGRRVNFSGLRLTPTRRKVRAGRKLTLQVTVTNSGNAAGTATVRLSSANRQKVKVPGQVRLTLDANGRATGKFQVRTRRRKAGTVKVTAKLGSLVARTAIVLRR